MAEKLRVGVVGMQFGMRHMEGVQAHPDAELIAICDCREARVKDAGLEHDVPEQYWYTDWHEVAKNPDVDAVILAVPDQLHREMVVEFLNNGKHVMCEKPLALTQEDVNAIVEAANASDKKFMVGQICRFTAAFAKAKEIIDAGDIGEIYFVESEYAHDYTNTLAKVGGNWRADPVRHGVIGGGCHAVDLLRWFAGDPLEVFAYGTHKLLPQVPYDDATISVIKFPNGVIGKVFVSTGCKRNYTMRTLVYGTKGTIICDNTSPTMQLFKVGENGMAPHDPEIIEIEVNNHNTAKEFEIFADAVINGTPLEMTAEEGAKTVATCIAIVKSAESGKPEKPDFAF